VAVCRGYDTVGNIYNIREANQTVITLKNNTAVTPCR